MGATQSVETTFLCEFGQTIEYLPPPPPPLPETSENGSMNVALLVATWFALSLHMYSSKAQDSSTLLPDNKTIKKLLRSYMRKSSKRRTEKLQMNISSHQTNGNARSHQRNGNASSVKLDSGPKRMPSMEEVIEGKTAIQYDNGHFHFAVCGASGTGKSSFINAVRGISSKHENAAAVGATGSTSTVTIARYPDPRNAPFSLFVWFDIPGAGTLDVPQSEYFNHNKLYLFDFIIMVHGIRFTAIDLEILEKCRSFNIPVFVVRSKADQDIRNMGDDDGWEQDENYYRRKYVEETRQDYRRNLDIIRATRSENDGQEGGSNFLDNRLYIISRDILRCHATTDQNSKLKENQQNKVVDEMELIVDMLKTALQRRGVSQEKDRSDALACTEQ